MSTKLKCRECGDTFNHGDLKAGSLGWGCPKCGCTRLSIVDASKKPPYKWEEANTKFNEGGGHD